MDPSIKASRAEAQALPVGLQIGKKGITEQTVLEIRKQLKKRGILKIRLLQSAFSDDALPLQTKAYIQEVLTRTPALLVLHVGRVFTIIRPKGEEQHTPLSDAPAPASR
ncbi:MAG: YhbY family RNA-binding protein [DPANN group archaeon]|nr:YhbY family RNA-binding protein [DPANN group archaeon]